MFIVVYQWRVRKGKESQFQKAWAELTRGMMSETAARGARLHLCEDGTWIGYAQWQDKAAWEKTGPLSSVGQQTRARMADAVESLERISTMTVVEDFFPSRE